ncbi:MAG: transketolase [Chloroflexota bacterium]
MSSSQLDDLCINTIRLLAVDAVQKANSGHPGAPMGMAPMAYVLWDRFLKHNPADPKWPDRDRFLLSAGHASAMLYALLHLTGYDLPLDEIKRFRQWGSKTPGHPEYRTTPGVEATTGMLGQGFANGVGMAIAERWLAEHYNCPGHEIIDHYTYGIVSDGDLQEGISSEAASLAGKLRLGKLIYLYDDNDISIEGSTDLSFTEDVGKRFEAYGWHVVGPLDGMDPQAVEEAIKAAQRERERPSLLICRTVIGYGSPNRAGTAKAHGEALGEEEVRLTKENLGWNYREPFAVPLEAQEHLRKAIEHGRERQRDWETRLEAYRQSYPGDYEALMQDLQGRLPEGWDQGLSGLFDGQEKPLSTRKASGQVMSALASRVRALAGGSADLGTSVKTIIDGLGDFDCGSYTGHNLHFGVREHAMAGIANGMALHGGMIPYASTFLVFYDYMRPAVRMAALMGIRVIFVFSHDSVGVGEDGPTHQPVEQVLGLRSVPNLVTVRPADAVETAEAWKIALERIDGPTALILTRQDVPVLERSATTAADGVRRGGYVLWEASTSPEVLLIGTGSEVQIALEAGKLLQQKGVQARVVSLPSWELFDSQPEEYRNRVLPPNVPVRVSVEAGTPLGWEHYIGARGKAVGVPGFGASAPWKDIYQHMGLTAEHVADEAMQLR